MYRNQGFLVKSSIKLLLFSLLLSSCLSNPPAKDFSEDHNYMFGAAHSIAKRKAYGLEKRELWQTHDFQNEAILLLGKLAVLEKKFAQAHDYYEQVPNNADALSGLARMYYAGYGVDKDYAKSLQLLQLPLQQNEGRAHLLMAWIYQNGDGIKKDFVLAKKHYLLAIKAGSARACYLYAHALMEAKIGLAADGKTGLKFLAKAADIGHYKASFELAQIYQSLPSSTAEQKQRMINYYKHAASGGEEKAVVALLQLLIEENLILDENDLLEQLEFQARNKSIRCQRLLAYSLENGSLAGKKDEARAVAWYRQSARSGDAPSLHSLGAMYLDGRGCKADQEMGLKCLTTAMKRHYAPAATELGLRYIEGQGLVKSKDQGMAFLDYAISLGDNDAAYHLGRLLLLEQPHSSEARKMLEKAAATGHLEAKKLLKKLPPLAPKNKL